MRSRGHEAVLGLWSLALVVAADDERADSAIERELEIILFSLTAIGQSMPVHVLLAYCNLCWFVSSRNDILKLQENEPRDYLVSPTNKIKT